MIWLIRNILLALSSETNPAQIAFGAVFGITLGLCPMDNFIWYACAISVLLFRINIGMTLVFLTVGQLIHLSIGSLLESIGNDFLNVEQLSSFFTTLYNLPIIGISGFNKPSVMGALVLSVVLSVVLIPLMIYITKIFRSKLQPKLEKIWIIKVLKSSKLYQYYTKIVG
jgi:uncharacterized protein (TIGR03546 family)